VPGLAEALADANRRYEERFGHLFIVCASGLSGEEMLARLEHRLRHHPEDEWKLAAGEQAKITRLRLQKLLGEG
jgi:2-oxo-4-hydroxy-4-carboxy-5-ureidoimidazoline decarboxylase